MIGIGNCAAAAGFILALSAPAEAASNHRLTGIAAFYDLKYHGPTASGVRYDPQRYTAAHKTLPFGTRLKVTDLRTGRSVEVTVNDRGPFKPGRILDLSLAAAKRLGMIQRGLARVTASVVGR